MIQFLLSLFKKKPRCLVCDSADLKHGYWTRGWNNLCHQATGDNGTRCFDCGHIDWDRTREEYDAALPDWCEYTR